MMTPFQERRGTVAFQGALGANSHVACQQTLPQMQVLPCVDFDAAFEALQKGGVDLALIPIENSSAGRVADMHRLLPGSGLHIIGEHYLPIAHALVAAPGTRLEEVRHVYSHEQALHQCRDFLRARNMNPHKFSDTAAAGKWIGEQGKPDQAALCPALAAEFYNLEVLVENVSDRARNTTRFVLLSRAAELPPRGAPTVTSLVFQTKSEPASLYKALTGFATTGINLTKLESCLVGDAFEIAQFYIDVLAHQEDPAFQIALGDLRHYCVPDGVTLMGSYPAHAYRGLS